MVDYPRYLADDLDALRHRYVDLPVGCIILHRNAMWMLTKIIPSVPGQIIHFYEWSESSWNLRRHWYDSGDMVPLWAQVIFPLAETR